MILLVGDVNALQAVNVARQAALVDVGFTSLHHLGQGVVDKDILFFGLDQVVALTSDVFEKVEDVDIASGLDLPEHGVDCDEAPCSAHSGTEMSD